MPDYSKSIIYTIRTGDGLDVGSTTSYTMRKYHHKSNCYNENKKDYNTKLYKTIRENNGEWNMKPHKEFPCENKIQLSIEEERVRREMNADLNMYKCYKNNDDKKYVEDKKIYDKQYRKINGDKRRERNNTQIICECGIQTTNGRLCIHRKTKRHIKLMDIKS